MSPNLACLVPYRFLPARTGGEKCIDFFLRYLSRRVSVVVVGTFDNEKPVTGAYEINPLIGTSRFRYINPANFFRIRRLLIEKQVTHLMIEHPYLGWLGILLQRSTGVKLIVQSHNIEGLRWKSLGKWWWELLWSYERFTHRQADLSFFITPEDLAYAREDFAIPSGRSGLATYGIERSGPPAGEERAGARLELRTRHSIPASAVVMLFNGSFSGPPNQDALRCILTEIVPRLDARGLDYRIVICGGGVPPPLIAQGGNRMIFTGFVPDISRYTLGADIFINPVRLGGGIKTKLVEALGDGLNAVSVISGATGVDPRLCGGKLGVVADDDWDGFTEAVEKMRKDFVETPAGFYDCFYWGNIADKAAELLLKA